jgi:hypothetical protein
MDIDGSLVMLAERTKDGLEICQLELASQAQEPRVCFLDVVSRVDKEGVPTVFRPAQDPNNSRRNVSFPSVLQSGVQYRTPCRTRNASS